MPRLKTKSRRIPKHRCKNGVFSKFAEQVGTMVIINNGDVINNNIVKQEEEKTATIFSRGRWWTFER
jgi:hypothetical protein